MKVDINTKKTPQFISWPLIIGFATPIIFTLYQAGLFLWAYFTSGLY